MSLELAKRELREEVGKSAATWEALHSFYVSPGFTNERIHAFLATDLSDETAEADEEERIEIVSEPLHASTTSSARAATPRPWCHCCGSGPSCSRQPRARRSSGAAWPRRSLGSDCTAPCAVKEVIRRGRIPRGGLPIPSLHERELDGDFEQLVLDFIAYLELERGMARNTLASYRSDLLQFGAYLAEHKLDPATCGRARCPSS